MVNGPALDIRGDAGTNTSTGTQRPAVPRPQQASERDKADLRAVLEDNFPELKDQKSHVMEGLLRTLLHPQAALNRIMDYDAKEKNIRDIILWNVIGTPQTAKREDWSRAGAAARAIISEFGYRTVGNCENLPDSMREVPSHPSDSKLSQRPPHTRTSGTYVTRNPVLDSSRILTSATVRMNRCQLRQIIKTAVEGLFWKMRGKRVQATGNPKRLDIAKRHVRRYQSL